MKKVDLSPKIWLIPNFLSNDECDSQIEFSEKQGYEEASVSLSKGPRMIKSLRNNDRLIFEDFDLAACYWDRLKPFCPEQLKENRAVAIGLNERFRYYRYETEQRFKRHIDGRFKKALNIESRITFMVYLNDDFDGGETAFDEVIVEAEKGTALCFIHEQKHEGRPVRSGVKYVLRSDVMYQAL